MRVSLLRFFKTFQTYLAYVFLGYLFHYCDFLAYAFFVLFTSLLRFFAYFLPKNRSNEIKSPKTHKPNIFGEF